MSIKFEDLYYYDELEVPEEYKKQLKKQKAILEFQDKKFPNSNFIGERETFKVMGIPVFTWNRWEDAKLGVLKFYNCEFTGQFNIYNGSTSIVDAFGKIKIIPLLKDIPIWEGYFIEMPRFRKILQEMFKRNTYPIYIPEDFLTPGVYDKIFNDEDEDENEVKAQVDSIKTAENEGES